MTKKTSINIPMLRRQFALPIQIVFLACGYISQFCICENCGLNRTIIRSNISFINSNIIKPK